MTNITEILRYTLYGILIAILLLMFQAWDKDHPKPLTVTHPATEATTNYIPQVTNTAKTAPVQEQQPANTVYAKGSSVQITTDVFKVDIDTLGGNIAQVSLLKYPEELHSNNPVVLLNDSSDTRYLAQSGLLSAIGPDTSKGQGLYTTDQTHYELNPGQNELKVNLYWQNQAGLKIIKTFTFHRNNYEVNVTYQVVNKSQQAWDGNLYLQLMRKNTPPASKQGFMNLATYFGAAISTPDKPFLKVPFKEMNERNLNLPVTGGWAAMIQHYFVSAWVPDKNSVSQYFSRVTNDGLYTIGMLGPKMSVNPGETATTDAKFYAGPSVVDNLEKVAPGLQLTIDYGWFWFISAPILWVMQKIYSIVGNWGWSIVLVTVLIKILFFQLSAKSYRSMSAMKKLQPKINALKERFGEDKQKFTQATLELYKKEKVNPMSGCLPILIQIPVFIALYWVLIESVELRQAPFIFWIQDLSTKDPFYVLPILMGFSMFIQQRLNPPPPDPMQAKVMAFMPVIFTVLFINFPAGLMLYWFVNNTLSFTQQWYIMRSMEKAEKAKKK